MEKHGRTRVAVIGCGNIARNAHIPAYLSRSDVECLYFCDIRKDRADEMMAKYGVGKAVRDYRDVLADPRVDAISVCTPNDMHGTISIDAMRAGKDVLCEKPVARTLDEALEMRNASRETGRILNIGVVNRFNGAVRKIKELIDEGRLGQVYHVYVSFRSRRSIPGLGRDFTNRKVSGGGVLIDWGIHFLDLVLFCCGDPMPRTVSGKAFSVLGKDMEKYVYENMWAGPPDFSGTYDVDDFVTGFLRTDGPTITLNGAWAQNIGTDEMFIDFLGEKAGIRLRYGSDFTLYGTRNGNLVDDASIHFGQQPMFEAEIEDFLETVRTRRASVADVGIAIRSTGIIQALYDSSSSGREIDFGEYNGL